MSPEPDEPAFSAPQDPAPEGSASPVPAPQSYPPQGPVPPIYQPQGHPQQAYPPQAYPPPAVAQTPRRFGVGATVGGAAIGFVLAFVAAFLGLAIAGQLGSTSTAAALWAVIGTALLPVIGGIVLAAVGKGETSRGLGLGIVIGAAAAIIIAGGSCVLLIRAFAGY